MSAGPGLVACPHCGSLHRRIPLEPGGAAVCSLCGYVLYRVSRLPLSAWIGLVLGALLVFGIANAFPIVSLSFKGLIVEASLPGALLLTWRNGDYGLAVLTGLFGFWFPLTQLLVTLWALLVIRSGRLPHDFHFGMRLLSLSIPWSMLPVVMLAIIVALVKFAGFATVHVQPAIWAFAVLTVLFTILARMTPYRLWFYAEDAGLVVATRDDILNARFIGACECCGHLVSLQSAGQAVRCPRCRSVVHYRHEQGRVRAWAFLFTAVIAYFPANLLPIMRIRAVGTDESHTILGGVIELWQLGSWDLALVVFVASVAVPITKLLALFLLLVKKHWVNAAMQRQRTRLYELVEFIGQWSMLDVFVVVLLGAMANFSGLSQISAQPGAFAFGVVVVFTMFAAMSFDPRRGWDQRFTSSTRVIA